MKDASELAALIRAAARGDRAAFDELVLSRRETVLRTAYQITGNREDALDVAQAVFLRLWKVLRRFDVRRRFDTWLYRITVNAAIDYVREKGPRGVMEPLSAHASDVANGSRGGVESAIDLGRLQQAFLRLAAALPPRQRAVIVMRDIEGIETPEIARILGVSESTVRNHLMQARRTLRAGLERDYPDLVPGWAGKGGQPS